MKVYLLYKTNGILHFTKLSIKSMVYFNAVKIYNIIITTSSGINETKAKQLAQYKCVHMIISGAWYNYKDSVTKHTPTNDVPLSNILYSLVI